MLFWEGMIYMDTSTGRLKIEVFNAEQAIPIENAKIVAAEVAIEHQ
jgi:hypothetical protein